MAFRDILAVDTGVRVPGYRWSEKWFPGLTALHASSRSGCSAIFAFSTANSPLRLSILSVSRHYWPSCSSTAASPNRARVSPRHCGQIPLRLRARSSLRNLLHQVRQTLPSPDRYLDITSTYVEWLTQAPFALDVEEFETAIRQAEHEYESIRKEMALAHAVVLYNGDTAARLLRRLDCTGAYRLQRDYLVTLNRLVELCDQLLDYKSAIDYAWRLQRINPLAEEPYRHLIRLNALTANRSEAIRCYDLCVSTLAQELGVEPDAETQEMYTRILQTPRWIREGRPGLRA